MLEVLLLALALGFKHSYDPDHLVAVSTLVSRSRSFGSAARLGSSWAVGHMITAGVLTSILFIFREALLQTYFSIFESVVAYMLILLGLWSLREAWKQHVHVHTHDGAKHMHVHEHAPKHAQRTMLGIGIIHGLASNDELLILLTALFIVPDLLFMLLGIGVFSIGVVMGMAVFGGLIGLVGEKGSERIRKLVVIGAGALSVAYGLALVLGLA